jgi:methionyl-tRNA synthetase
LANNLGNLVSRVLAMQNKYFSGIVQPMSSGWAKEDRALEEKFAQAEAELHRHMAELQFHRALESVWAAIDHANRYIVQTAPFTLFKDPAQQTRVGEVLHHLLEAIRQLSGLLAPFMPDTSKKLQRLLGLKEGDQAHRAPWGHCFALGHKIGGPTVLFPRIEPPSEA